MTDKIEIIAVWWLLAGAPVVACGVGIVIGWQLL